MKTDDPICGNCGKKRSNHYQEDDGVYCFRHTSGDVFKYTPNDMELMAFYEEKHPRGYARLVREWRQENGHE